MRHRLLTALSIALASCSSALCINTVAFASTDNTIRNTVVIEDRGGVSITQFIDEPETQKPERKTPDEYRQAAQSSAAAGYFDPSLYPISTPSMSVGPVTAEEAERFDPTHVQFSFFVVGYDQVSIRWLQDNVDALERNYAIGLVVNVDTPEQLQALYNVTDNRLVLTPASGETLAQSVHLNHYPAYIDNQRGLLH